MNWQKNIKIGLLGIMFGIILLMLRILASIPEALFWIWYLAGSVAVIVILCCVFYGHLFWFRRRLRRITQKLDAGQTDACIEEYKQLLEKTKNGYKRAILQVNLSVCYCEKKDYQTGKAILKAVDTTKLQKLARSIYYIDLAYCCFKNNDTDEALELMEEHCHNVPDYPNRPDLKNHLRVLAVFELVVRGEYDTARELLDQYKEQITDPTLQEDIETLDKYLGEE